MTVRYPTELRAEMALARTTTTNFRRFLSRIGATLAGLMADVSTYVHRLYLERSCGLPESPATPDTGDGGQFQGGCQRAFGSSAASAKRPRSADGSSPCNAIESTPAAAEQAPHQERGPRRRPSIERQTTAPLRSAASSQTCRELNRAYICVRNPSAFERVTDGVRSPRRQVGPTAVRCQRVAEERQLLLRSSGPCR